MKWPEIIARIKAVLHPVARVAMAAIRGETEPQILSQAMDVAREPWRRAAMTSRIAELERKDET